MSAVFITYISSVRKIKTQRWKSTTIYNISPSTKRSYFFCTSFSDLLVLIIQIADSALVLVTGSRGRRARDRMVVEFTTSCTISAYHH